MNSIDSQGKRAESKNYHNRSPKILFHQIELQNMNVRKKYMEIENSVETLFENDNKPLFQNEPNQKTSSTASRVMQPEVKF